MKVPQKELHAQFYVIAMCAMPLIAMLMPRFTAVGPPLIAVGTIAVYYYTFRTWPAISRRAVSWALAFPELMALSAIWSIDPQISLIRAAKTLPVILSAPLLWSLAESLDDKSVATFKKYFPWAVTIAGLFLFIELYVHAPLYHLIHMFHDTDKRFSPSQLNRPVVIFALCSFFVFYYLRDNTKMILRFTALVAAVLLATHSQSVQPILLWAPLFYFLFPYKNSRAWTTLVALIAAALFATPLITQFMFYYFAYHLDNLIWLKGSYVAQRMEIWDFVSRRALESPFMGFGADAMRSITDFDSEQLYWHKSEAMHPHNFAVQLWIEFGAIGALAAALFFTEILENMRKFPVQHARILLPCFIGCLSVAATSYGLWQSWWLGTFCLLFGYAAVILKDASDMTSKTGY